MRIPAGVRTTTLADHSNTDGNIGDELEKYAESKFNTGHWTERTRLDYESVFETFVDIIGNKRVSAITESDISEYLQAIDFLPPNRKKNPEFCNLNAAAAVSRNKLKGGTTISVRSKNKYIERLAGPFETFVTRGYCRYNYFKHADRYKITRADRLAARDPFSISDLETIFEHEASVELLSKNLHKPSRPWGLLIALYTGARAEEIFSLALDDIQLDGTTLFFDIRDREGHSRVKTDAAVRAVPVHPNLIELGFEKYVQKVRKVQSDTECPMLFPDIKKSAVHGWSRETPRWYNEQFLPKIGVKVDHKKVFHSFRHTISDRFKRDWVANQLMVSSYLGHEDDYGKLPEWKKGYGSRFSPSELVEIAKLIKFDLDFKKLKKKCLDKLIVRRKRTS